ncbi:hypothetical protein [uncultured Clostridium sp.]|uniref:hypothetical protein n=1 Tax=uncultured Clostridium sp. TaxID=59620 RepID=UPI00260A8590|nr:hypothetical protein [uncultured Clostridium sp.]
MNNFDKLIKYNEHIILNFDISDDRIFKILLALECILNFDDYQSFDLLKLCKFTKTPFDEIESYIDILLSSSIITSIDTESKFINLYKLNYDVIQE